jgi:hypothetical protein
MRKMKHINANEEINLEGNNTIDIVRNPRKLN